MSENRFLDAVNSPSDIKKLSVEQLNVLAGEIRDELIATVSKNGGHLASNLGAVELTIALHKTFNSPEDKIIWDVGHQAYTHKILTGRREKFSTIRTEGGLSGFTRPSESEHDVFASGHSSISVSAAYGVSVSNKLLFDDARKTIAVIGDGSFTGGLVYEGLNNAGRDEKSNLIVILNDNNMSISKNVGSVATYLSKIRTKPRYYLLKTGTYRFLSAIPGIGKPIAKFIRNLKNYIKSSVYGTTMFEKMGFAYMGPFDGHDIEQLCSAFEIAKNKEEPVMIHVLTKKGKGYNFAEESPSTFHGISKFDVETGESVCGKESYSEFFGKMLCREAEKNNKICAITAAMSLGTGLERFSDVYADRFFDVGIAEEHAVTFASGLAKNGMIPVFCVYSTFLQRCYDQIIHDCAMQDLKIILAIDRAGFVGLDGESHQGLFDVPFLNTIPKIEVYSPSSFDELDSVFDHVVNSSSVAVAVRYPRGCEEELPEDYNYSGDDFDIYGDKGDTAIVVYGRLFANACKAKAVLKEKGIDVRIIKLNKIKPINKKVFENISGLKNIYFFEESVKNGSIAERFGSLLLENGYKGAYDVTAVGEEFVKPATVESQLKKYGLDADSMVKKVSESIG
ncbi:MAG: 1-deoxy-D-xylulose-5-phosphate synthase [Clostridia bacterium]|nr:1-deoxy-D-xylulose-5-phosphate synthase [Clostridia bacterium]